MDEQQVLREFIADVYDNLAAHEEAVKGLVHETGLLDPAVVSDLVRSLEARLPDPAGELDARLILAMIVATVAYRPLVLPPGRRISRRRLVSRIADLMLPGGRSEPAAT